MKREIKELQNIGIDNILRDKDLTRKFVKVANKYLPEFCVTCNHVLRDKFYQLINHKNPIDMSKSKFKLKKGTVISMTTEDWKEDITEVTITDEKAKKMLALSAAYIRYFDEAPNMDKYLEAVKSNTPVEKETSYRDNLIALKGIGEATADKIIENYATEADLDKAVNEGQDMEFLSEGAQEALKEKYFKE